MFVKKRLFGLLGTVAIIATACGSSTASTAPSVAAPSAAASTAASAAASAETPSGSASASASGGASPSAAASASSSAAAVDLADDQTLRVTLGAEDPATLDPSKASTSTDIGVLHALNRGLSYFDKDLNIVPVACRGHA